MRAFIFTLIFLSTFEAFAGLKMFLWDPRTTLAPLVLFAKEGETPETAARRYLRNIEKDPGMMELFFGQAPDLPLQGFREISRQELANSALLIANNGYDFTKKSTRLMSFNSVFGKAQTQTMILPILADAGLDLKNSREMRKIIADRFPLLVAMGGEDVDPEMYGEEKTLARETVVSRDRFEISVIQEYVRSGKGFLLGICRGQQISAVALGYKLIQDIPVLVAGAGAHANDNHEVLLRPTGNSTLLGMFPKGRIPVNSYHHQAVRFQSGGPLELAAVGEDGVTEALEFRNGRGLLLQFHPETMNNFYGQTIIQNVINQKKSKSIYSCGKAHAF